jgi:mannobiose 2-epimerase
VKRELLSSLVVFLIWCQHLKAQNAELQRLASEVKVDLVENILPFWSGKMIDSRNGGFYGRMDGYNKIYPEAEKGGILNARILWTFSSAFRVLKDSSYLNTATYSFNYILDKFIDRENGGTFRSVTAKGVHSDTRKQTYSQAFFIYALAEYYLATGDQEAIKEAENIFYCLEKYCFDVENNGYFEVYSRDWKKTDDLLIGEKSTDDRKTMNTHLHLLEAYTNLYRAWPDKIVAGRLKNMISLFLDKIIDPETGHLIVFMNERWVPTSAVHSYGHDIEASWLLQEAAEVLGDKRIISKVEKMVIPIVNAAMEGVQPDGSIVTEKDVENGLLNTNRAWWPQAETVVGLVNAFELTGDTVYLNKAIRCWEYIDKNLVDHQEGEWFNSVSPSGEINKRGDKAGFWKCPYHNGRMGIEIIRRQASGNWRKAKSNQ